MHGHDEKHAELACWACHDAAGMAVGPLGADDAWVTYVAEGGVDGADLPLASHTIAVEVDCSRCHFVDNPWGLAGEVSTP